MISGWEVVEDQAAVEDWEIKFHRNVSKRQEQTPKPHKKSRAISGSAFLELAVIFSAKIID